MHTKIKMLNKTLFSIDLFLEKLLSTSHDIINQIWQIRGTRAMIGTLEMFDGTQKNFIL